MTGTIICADGLVLAYPRKESAVGPFSFEVRNGECWALIGNNGAGKSTLLRYLAQIKGPARRVAGSVDLPGEIGYVPQRVVFPARHAVLDSLTYLLILRGTGSAKAEQNAKLALQIVNLGDFATRKVSHLSGGQLQRLAIAHALSTELNALLLDEPFTGLDIDQKASLARLIAQLTEDHSVVFSSHDLAEVSTLATHVLHVHEGKQVFEGPIDEYLSGARGHVKHGDTGGRAALMRRSYNLKIGLK